MQISNFENNLDPDVQARAWEYFQSGKVGHINHAGNTYSAFISGTHEYYVTARIQNGEVSDWSCDCPYELSPICKHVAAMLIAVRKNGNLSKATGHTIRTRDVESSVEERIHTLAKKALAWVSNKREPLFIYHHDDEFPSSYTEDQWQTGDRFTKMCREHKKYIREALERYGRRQYYYKQAMDATENAGNVLDWGEEAEKQREPIMAIACYLGIIETLVPALQHFDDSNAEFGDLIRASWEGLFRVAGKCNSEQMRKKLFTYTLKEMSKDKYKGWDDPWEFANLAALIARDEVDEQKLLAVVKNMIQPEEHGHWHSYQYDQYVALRLRLAEVLHGDSAVDRVLKEEAGNRAAYGTALARAYYRNDHNCMSEIAAAAEKAVADAPGLVSAYRHIVLSYSLRRGDGEIVVKIAMQLIADDWREGVLWYEVVKKYTPKDEWGGVRKRLLTHLEYETRKNILLRENSLDELAVLLTKCPEDILEYKLLFIEKYPNLIRAACHTLIEQKIIHTGSREHYREIVGHLKTLSSLSANDADVARALATTWRTKYKLRSNLCSELLIAGF